MRIVLVDPGDDVDCHVRVRLDEGLRHALSERSIAEDGRRDDVPSTGLGDEVGRDLATGHVPSGKSSSGRSPDRRLVDRIEDAGWFGGVRTGQCDCHEQSVVTRAQDAPDDLDLAVSEHLQRRCAVEHPPALVDVVAVAPRTDVTARIEWRPTQRAGWATGGDDLGRPRDERPRSRRGHAHPQEVWPVIVLVVIVLRVDGLALVVLGRASTSTRSAPPSQPSVSEPARNASFSGSSSGASSADSVSVVARPTSGSSAGAMPRRSSSSSSAPRRSASDLDLLERDRDDSPALAGLQEERPIARLPDRAGHESVRRIEDEAPSRHRSTLYRIVRRPSPRIPRRPLSRR